MSRKVNTCINSQLNALDLSPPNSTAITHVQPRHEAQLNRGPIDLIESVEIEMPGPSRGNVFLKVGTTVIPLGTVGSYGSFDLHRLPICLFVYQAVSLYVQGSNNVVITLHGYQLSNKLYAHLMSTAGDCFVLGGITIPILL